MKDNGFGPEGGAALAKTLTAHPKLREAILSDLSKLEKLLLSATLARSGTVRFALRLRDFGHTCWTTLSDGQITQLQKCPPFRICSPGGLPTAKPLAPCRAETCGELRCVSWYLALVATA